MTPPPLTGPEAGSSSGLDHRRTGPGRVIIALYVVFVIGSVSRATFQIATKFQDAPLAYTLSAIAAAVYVIATISLMLPGRRAWWLSLVAISTEMVGVLVVGAWSLMAPESFPDDTVWSGFGRGYLHIPLVLPVLGLWWLSRTRPAPRR